MLTDWHCAFWSHHNMQVLSMSRLGGAGAVAPLVADMSAEVNSFQNKPTHILRLYILLESRLMYTKYTL